MGNYCGANQIKTTDVGNTTHKLHEKVKTHLYHMDGNELKTFGRTTTMRSCSLIISSEQESYDLFNTRLCHI